MDDEGYRAVYRGGSGVITEKKIAFYRNHRACGNRRKRAGLY